MTEHSKIAILTYAGAQMSAVLGLQDMFTVANSFAEVHIETVQMAEPQAGVFQAVIVPPGLKGARGQGDAQVHAWLRAQQSNGALICSICAGAFWLGYAGMLEGRPATTHWALEDEFRRLFPKVLLNCDALLLDDNDVVTAGGVMAWVDLGLFLVRRWQGEQVVTQTARHLLVDTNGRQQSNYRSFRPNLTHGDKPIQKVQLWLEGHAAAVITQPELAALAVLSPRSFLRRFKLATGLTPVHYLQNLRIEKARGMLEHSKTPIADIAWQVGYRDASAFARVFKEVTGLTAGEYRRRFGLF